MSQASDILIAAQAQGVIIATAESCTGGLIGAAITNVAGSSAIYDRGFITYTNAAKIAMLGVSEEVLEAHGAVSEQVAGQMALGALTYSAAKLTVSTTGIAGPGGSDHKPEGRVCFGTATPEGVTTQTVEFGALGRMNVRRAATEHALGLLLKALQN